MTILSFRNISVFLVVIVLSLSNAHGQGGTGRQPINNPSPPVPTPGPRPNDGKRNANSSKRELTPAKVATLAINLPDGSRVYLNHFEIEVRNSDRPISVGKQKITTAYLLDQGRLIVSGLNPGTCELTVSKADHREFAQTIELIADRNNEITVHLTPIPGTLTVKPSVSGASVEVFNVESNMSLGRYPDQLNRFEIAPGTYRVSTSRDGYLTATRDITIRPGESVYLEPVVELLPKPKPTPGSALSRQVVPTSFFVQKRGKEEIFRIQGSTADASTRLGTIDVRHGGPSLSHDIAGGFNGFPCQVDFVRLENVAESAVIEAPGPSNQWNVIIVRIRRKDEKRAVSFAINWKSLQSASVPTDNAQNADQQSSSFTPGTALVKIKPHFPGTARQSLNGIVNVLVVINEYGSVISAKALDGPLMFRQISEEAARNWKFSPATRNGQPVESQQTIQFNFQN
ncbi:MAG TPA: energy transducer TonB [Pyrinomonadaceae bacterium]